MVALANSGMYVAWQRGWSRKRAECLLTGSTVSRTVHDEIVGNLEALARQGNSVVVGQRQY